MHMFIHGYGCKAPTVFNEKRMSEIKQQFYTSGDLTFDATHIHHPNRSDEKIMRQDVKGSILVINEMIEALGLKNKIGSVPLFVANGAFVENTDKYLNKILDVHKTFEPDTSEYEKINRIYKSSPPLLALETLTNSTMSFIAQYTGMKAHNATFGNTSMSAMHALQEANKALIHQPLAVVNSSNCGGDYSFLTNASVVGYQKNWKESAGVACLLLGSDAHLEGTCKAKITELRCGKSLPSLESNEIHRSWAKILVDASADVLIHSGAFSQEVYEADRKYCEAIQPNVFS